MNILYAAIQFFFWVAFGTAVSFASVYLLACSISNTVIGLVSALACGCSILAQPLLAAYADRRGGAAVKGISRLLAGMIAALGVLLHLAFGHAAWLNAALLCLAILLAQALTPMINALATVAGEERIRFGVTRGFGSLGYACMSYGVGRLTALRGAGSMPAVLTGAAAVLTLLISLFPAAAQGASASEKKPPASGGLGLFFRRYPGFLTMLAGCSLIYTCHMYLNSFVYQIAVSRGGDSGTMGAAMSLAGVLEIAPMFCFGFLRRLRGSGFWFRLSGVFFTLKALCTLLAASVPAFYAAQLIQPLGWGLMTVSIVCYVDEIMGAGDRVKGQACAAMTLSVGTILGMLSGGWLIDAWSVDGMLIVSVLFGAAGTLLTWISRPAGKAVDF